MEQSCNGTAGGTAAYDEHVAAIGDPIGVCIRDDLHAAPSEEKSRLGFDSVFGYYNGGLRRHQ
jgi:hypothetical protein